MRFWCGVAGLALVALLFGTAAGDQQVDAATDALHGPFDEILDLYVRDGLVYYNALKIERGRLDRYVASLAVAPATYAAWSRDEQIAYWLNAYNAFVLRSVVDHYPIRGQSNLYPANSIRQIPGAFERQLHRAAGRSVTLDEIEKTILPAFGDPRMAFALGRGALGSARLRSEAYSGSRLASQLAGATAEFVRDPRHVRVDRLAGEISVSPIIGWQEQQFTAALGAGDTRDARRSPIERAILTLIEPHLLPQEREFVRADTFKIGYHPFDWRLNDLTGGAPR